MDGTNLCNAFLNGQNCTIFVYGPTSTGKTFTMQGNAEDIIHGNLGVNKSNFISANVSPDISINYDDSVDQSLNNVTPSKSRRF